MARGTKSYRHVLFMLHKTCNQQSGQASEIPAQGCSPARQTIRPCATRTYKAGGRHAPLGGAPDEQAGDAQHGQQAS
jgi:hypothetical protein